MPPIAIQPCTLSDASSLARHNMSAFWTNPNWALVWRGKTLEHVIEQAARRMPHNLLTDTARRRHIKAVDEATGDIVGYIRFILPEIKIEGSEETGEDISEEAERRERNLGELWPEARVEDPGEKERKEAEEEFNAADWHPDHSTDELDKPITEMKKKLFERKEYILLDYLAVHPSHRRRGIATMLVQKGIIEAEKLGLDMFVLAWKTGYGVYSRCGFEVLDQIFVDATEYGGNAEYGAFFMERVVGERAVGG